MEQNDRVDACVYLCFILDKFGELPESVLSEMILSSSQQDYFEIIGNLGFMTDKKLIGKKECDGESVYFLLDEGKSLARDLCSRLSPALKEKTIAEGNAVITKKDRERSVKCTVFPAKCNESYNVNVKFLNELNGEIILDLTLYAPDRKKAEEMRERFLSKPSLIITRILNMFLKDDYFVYDKLTEEKR